MHNPWTGLPETGPYLLAEDQATIEKFNQGVREEFRIRTDVMPAPYVGNVLTAPIVILMLNPGFTEAGSRQEDDYFKTTCRKVFLHQPTSYPFFCLDTQIKVGRDYWQQKLKNIKDLPAFRSEGEEYQKVASQVCNIQYFPYSSMRYKHNPQGVPSQAYSFYLVREAIRRKAIVIVGRGVKHWYRAVEELENYPHYSIINKRNPCISQRNCPDAFEAIGKLILK